MMGGCFVLTLFVLIFDGVFADEVTVMEGDSVTLNSDVTKKHNEIMRWYFNGIHIAHINEDSNTSCLYVGENKIFRDSLEVNCETGSMNITNIRSEHAGHYELQHIKSTSTGKITNLNRNSKSDGKKIISKRSSSDDADIIKSFRLIVTDSGPSVGAVAGIVVAVLLLFVAAGVVGVILYRCRTAKKGEKKNNQETDGEKSNEDPLMKPVV